MARDFFDIKFKMDTPRFLRFIRYMLTKEGEQIITRHLSKATKKNGLEVVKLTRQIIKAKPFAKNADLTVALKKSSMPLIGSANQLFRAITSKPISDLEVFVGVLKASSAYNIAETVHGSIGQPSSKIIPVTKKMRGMFYLLYKASIDPTVVSDLTGRAKELWDLKPGGWYPLKQSTTSIRIPSRPFMEITFRDPKMIQILKRNWEKGLDDAFKEIKNRVG